MAVMPLTDADFLNNLLEKEPLQSDALVSQLESIVERAKAEKQSDQILVLLKRCSVTVGKKSRRPDRKAGRSSYKEFLQKKKDGTPASKGLTCLTCPSIFRKVTAFLGTA